LKRSFFLDGSRLLKQSSPSNKRWWLATSCVTVIAAVMHVYASAHGVLTIDSSRDMYWAERIASGAAFPLLGPPVGGINLLGPAWFYVLSLFWLASHSIAGFLGWVGLLVSLKYPLAAAVGALLRGARGAFFTVAACALPGLSTYQWIGASHPQFVETAVWLCLLLGISVARRGGGATLAAPLGLAVALAFHAHPTTVLLWPLLLWPWLHVRSESKAPTLLAGVGGFAALFVPALVAWFIQWPSEGSQLNASGASGLGGTLHAMPNVLRNVLWGQIDPMLSTFSASWLSREFAVALLGVYAIAVFIGLARAALGAISRVEVAVCAVSAIALGIALALLRDHVPFYMCYLVLPFVVLASSNALQAAHEWLALHRTSLPVVVFALCPLLVHISLAVGLSERGKAGRMRSWLPPHSNMAQPTGESRLESLLNAASRDEFAKWACAQPTPLSLHGDIVPWWDIGVDLDRARHCPTRAAITQLGGKRDAWVGLPNPVWSALGIAPTHTFGGYGLLADPAVIAPQQSLTSASGQVYPPRYNDMVRGAQAVAWTQSVDTPGDNFLVVSHMLLTSPIFKVEASINNKDQPATIQFANTSIFRCHACSATGAARWQLKIAGANPDFVSIVSIKAPTGSAKLSK
jgi:hypothetical protein